MSACKCSQAQSCAICSKSCECDLDATCSSCFAKPLPIPAEIGPREHNCKVDDGTLCEDCCEHGDMDDGQCLDCGADRTEDLMAAAYDRAKDARKYGDC